MCLALSLTACANKAIVDHQVIVLSPPEELTQDCLAVALKGDTNADLARYAADLKFSLNECSADKGAIRDWVIKASKG